MKTIRHVNLYLQKGTSDTESSVSKLFEVDICEYRKSEDDRYVVNFRYGSANKPLREGTKTRTPVSLAKAQKIFDSVVVNKINEGYVSDDAELMAFYAQDINEQDGDKQDTSTTWLSAKTNELSNPPNRFDHEKATAKILTYLENPPKHWQLSRIVWRAGELGIHDAGDKIVEIAINAGKKTLLAKKDQSPFLMRYSCLWSLARCGSARHIADIDKILAEKIGKKRQDKLLNRLGYAVQLLLATKYDDPARSGIANKILGQLPKHMADSITENSTDASALVSMVKELAKPEDKRRRYYEVEEVPKEQVNNLIRIYQLSLLYPSCRDAIHTLLADKSDSSDYSINTTHFDLCTQLFKFSELYQDTDTFAKLIPVFERFQPNWAHSFNERSINYYRRRSWRVLRKLGASNQTAYLDFAESILLNTHDDDAQAPRTVKRYGYDWETYASFVESERDYGSYPRLLAFNHVLYQNSTHKQPVPSRLSWFIANKEPEQQRTEAFPHLWQAQPQRLLKLLLHSDCIEVHEFAVKALKDNPEFCLTLATDRENLANLEKLLNSPYAITADFALELARHAFDQSADSAQKVALIKSCLATTHLPANRQALAWLQQHPDLLTTDFSLFAYTLFHSAKLPELVTSFDGMRLSSVEKNQLISAMIAFIKQSPQATDNDIEHVITHLKALTLPNISSIALSVIDELLTLEKHIETQIEPHQETNQITHTETHKQLFGALLLLENDTAIKDIPDSILLKINESPSPRVQAVAVSLLAKLTDKELLEKYHVLLGFVVSDNANMRQAVHPIVKRLVDNDCTDIAKNSDKDTHIALRMLNDIIPYVFKSETSEGVHADLLHLAQTALAPALPHIEPALRWRLLHAQSKSAKKMGALAIEEVSFDTYSVKQWALLGNNEMLRVRQQVWHHYDANIDTIKQQNIKNNLIDALRLTNTKWQDSRAFAIDYFKHKLNDDDWTPALIISICDSTFDDVQRLGRDLLTRCFKESDGATYLTHLSQHPSQNVQLFSTNFLEDYASDDEARILSLQHFFVTLLSQVYKGRVAKDRVMSFLTKEALKNHTVAKMVADIYTRQSVTMAITDKAQFIQGMHAIRQVHPDIAVPMTVQPLSIKPTKQPLKNVVTNSSTQQSNHSTTDTEVKA